MTALVWHCHDSVNNYRQPIVIVENRHRHYLLTEYTNRNQVSDVHETRGYSQR